MSSDSLLTTNAGLAYRQAIGVVNDLIYRDGDDNRTLDPTNNRQSIVITGAAGAVTLYTDAEGNPTTSPSNPSIVVTDTAPSGVTLVDLYLDHLGQKSTRETPNRLYAATDSNSAPLIYYDNQGLEVQTADQQPTARVKDNGTSAGTAQYSLTRNQPATIEVFRNQLVIGTRAFDLYRSVLDSGTDTFIIDHDGGVDPVIATLDYDGVTDISTLAGFSIDAEALEAMEVRLGDQSDLFTINTTNVTTTIRTNGGVDTVHIETAAGDTHVFTGDGNDIVNIKQTSGDSFLHGGNDDDIFNVGNDAGKLSDIDGALTIHGDADFDIINIDNSNANTDSAGALFFNLITGLDMGGLIVYDTAEDLNIDLGTGSDDFTVASTHAGTTDINANLGNNRLLVKTIDGDTSILTSIGTDTVTVGDTLSPLAGIRALLTIDADGDDGDALIINDIAADAIRSGQLFDDHLVGFGLASSIDFTNFENLDLNLGGFRDALTVESTIAGTTRVDTGDAGDVVKIETYTGNTFIATGLGSDRITLFDGDGDFAAADAYLELNGGGDGDDYVINKAVTGVGASFVNLRDTGADGDPQTSGIDELIFNGSADLDVGDVIQLDTVYVRGQDPTLEFNDDRWTGYGQHGEGLIISHFDADDNYQQQDINDADALLQLNEVSLNQGSNIQVVNYSTIEQVTIFAGAGDDKIISDDTAQQVDVFGNEGDDQFFVGSVLETELVFVEGQEIAIVTQITHGASFPMNFYGGDDDDYFEVNHNVADIALFGDNGNDTFFIKALLTINEDEDLVELDNAVATVSGVTGEGSEESQKLNDTREVDLDALVYVENANVRIDGGAGFDSVAIVGTVLSDTFYVFTEVIDGQTVQRIFGAGVKLREATRTAQYRAHTTDYRRGRRPHLSLWR